MKALRWSWHTERPGRAAALAAVAAILLVGRPAAAQQREVAAPATAEAPASASKGMAERVSLDFKSTEVMDALKYLAEKGRLNIAISKGVAGRVNLSLTDVPIQDVFELILRSNELAYAKQGDVYHVMTEPEYKALYGRRFADLRAVRTFRLQYAMPEPAFNLLDALKSEIGRLLVDEESGTVLVLDTPEQLQRMEEALATLEQGGTLRVFDLKYAKAKDVEERLKDQIELKKLGFIKADDRSNQVIVKTLPERMQEVERLIAALDQKTREVLIDAKIIKVTLTNRLDTGIDWDALFTNLKLHGLDKQQDFKLASTAAVPSAYKIGLGQSIGKLALGTLSNDGFEVLRYLERLGETKVIATPRIMAINGQEAKIMVGTKEAYVTTTTTTGSSTSTVAEEVKFIDVGIQLSVTPTINADGYVTMKIKPEVSNVARQLVTPSRNQIPIVDTSMAETTVMVKDGTTVILGGLSKEQKQFANQQIPLLGRIPVIGEAFRRRDKDDERAELVVFITPRIVTGDEYVWRGTAGVGAQIKPYRDYGPVLEDEGPAASEPAAPPGRPLPLEPGMPIRMRDQLRGYPGAD